MSSTKDKGYVTLNFDELNEKGLDKLKKAISKAGYEVVKITPAGPARRKDGIPVKTFELKGIDEQVMSIQVNNTGDISGIKLNGKNAPYTPVKTMAELGKSLADLFRKGSTAFQKSLSRKLARAAKKDTDGNKPQPSKGVKSGVQMLSDARARRDELKGTIATTQKKIESLSSDSDEAKKSQENIQAALNLEMAKTSQLEKEIAQLKEGTK
ncbi:defense against restriction DarA-related protein [Citrobacter sp. NCU1]|uniref:defense against restriction DarA-related protein n=1 Tax=Citrobacter sp. NCU1 TaxID=2026683 RepID=UPI00313B78AA